jgi:hypothetical protein
VTQDDCDGCEHHQQFSWGISWCFCDKQKEIHDQIQDEYRAKGWIGAKGRVLPPFNKVHSVCPDSTNPPLKEGDLTLDLNDL